LEADVVGGTFFAEVGNRLTPPLAGTAVGCWVLGAGSKVVKVKAIGALDAVVRIACVLLTVWYLPGNTRRSMGAKVEPVCAGFVGEKVCGQEDVGLEGVANGLVGVEIELRGTSQTDIGVGVD
jgi:hypothetical protein